MVFKKLFEFAKNKILKEQIDQLNWCYETTPK
jgi:hypothetical protein